MHMTLRVRVTTQKEGQNPPRASVTRGRKLALPFPRGDGSEARIL